ncbi:unnamed protein product, partial [Phaeothamnion confervicola]
MQHGRRRLFPGLWEPPLGVRRQREARGGEEHGEASKQLSERLYAGVGGPRQLGAAGDGHALRPPLLEAARARRRRAPRRRRRRQRRRRRWCRCRPRCQQADAHPRCRA